MDSSVAAGRVFNDRYRLLALIGAGANSSVFVADDLALRRRVAVKVFAAEAASDERFVGLFEEAAAAAVAQAHPHLLAVYDWSLEPSCHLVSEYLPGGSLRSMLDSVERLSRAQALVVGLEAARALRHLHSGGLVHCGVKPSNLLFDSDGRLRLADAGIAPALAAAGRPPEHGCVAPEQSPGEPGTPAADVYCLALVLCEAVTATASVPSGPDSELGPLWYAVGPALEPAPGDRPSAAGLAKDLLSAAEMLSRPEPLPLAGAAVGDQADAPPSASPAGAGRRTSSRAAGRARGPSPASSRSASKSASPAGRSRGASASAGADAGRRRSPSPAPARSPIPLDDPPRRRWPGLLLATVLVLASAAGGAWAWLEARPEAQIVPDLTGIDRAEAVSAAAGAGWPAREVLVRAPGTGPGEVVRVEPVVGSELAAGEELTLFVSLGEPLVAVPDAYALSVDDAEAAVADLGLVVVGDTPVSDEQIPEGFVVGVDVPAGVYELEPGSEVRLLVSSGPADRPVPAVPADRSVIAAQQELLAARLLPLEVSEFSLDVPVGLVVGFRPASGQVVPPGTRVEVLISQGPSQVEVPDVVGRSVADAVELLSEVGFVVEVDGSEGLPVASMDPSPGEFPAYGSSVVISTDE